MGWGWGVNKKRKYGITISKSYETILLLKSDLNAHSREKRFGRNTCEEGSVEQRVKL